MGGGGGEGGVNDDCASFVSYKTYLMSLLECALQSVAASYQHSSVQTGLLYMSQPCVQKQPPVGELPYAKP